MSFSFRELPYLQYVTKIGWSVVVANLRRVQESLRSLEEFGKLLDGEFAAVMKGLRYRVYVLEQRLCGVSGAGRSSVGEQRRARLQQSRLYVLITESQCRGSWQETVRLVLEGGADIVQLREKQLGDAELLRRAKWLPVLQAQRDQGRYWDRR